MTSAVHHQVESQGIYSTSYSSASLASEYLWLAVLNGSVPWSFRSNEYEVVVPRRPFRNCHDKNKIRRQLSGGMLMTVKRATQSKASPRHVTYTCRAKRA